MDYSTLHQTSGIVQEKSENYYKKRIFVKLRLVADGRIYFQEYTRRFHDANLASLQKGKPVTFYTTLRDFKKHKPFLSKDASDAFIYQPIFNINNSKQFFSVFLWHIYRSSVLSILIGISIAGTFFYMIPFITITNWRNRIILLSICAFYVWLWY